jgi:thiamine-monophosphate kinase
VGAEVDSSAIPLASVGKPAHAVDLDLAVHGGEDYELLFTAPPNKKLPTEIASVPITRIGAITRGKQIKLQSPDGKLQPLPARGWQHLA